MNVGDILIERGLLTRDEMARAVELRQSPDERLDRVLVRLGLVEDHEAMSALAESLGMPFVDLGAVTIDEQVLRQMPSKLIHKQEILPFQRTNGALMVATADPFDIYAFDELQLLTGLRVEPVLASKREIMRVIKAYFGVGGETVNEMVGRKAEDGMEILSETSEDVEDLEELAQEASVVKLVNEILYEAVDERASDVHIEPTTLGLRIRYRIDGVLHTASLPAQIQRFRAAIVSRIKIMSNLNIAEKRLPQDGRIKIRVRGNEVDIRVSIIPMLFGEGVVMRILDKSKLILNLREVGMTEAAHDIFEELINLPNGILLVTGPTGCGKTTTLYASLNEIRSEDLKIITVEDPVEYHLEGVNQIQVHSKIGLTFARGLRSILRHDPDVVMIGEVRDLETGEAAVQASLTGHLVFSTLHTNDAAGAMTRLTDMGVEPFLVTSSVEGVMAQRLVRQICDHCKEPYRPDVDALPDDFPKDRCTELMRGRGCRECRNTGYRGRTGIFELLRLTGETRELTMRRAGSNEIKEAAIRAGMRPLRRDGWDKVLEGTTTVEEVVRATKAEG